VLAHGGLFLAAIAPLLGVLGLQALKVLGDGAHRIQLYLLPFVADDWLNRLCRSDRRQNGGKDKR